MWIFAWYSSSTGCTVFFCFFPRLYDGNGVVAEAGCVPFFTRADFVAALAGFLVEKKKRNFTWYQYILLMSRGLVYSADVLVLVAFFLVGGEMNECG